MICTNRWFFLFSDPCRRRGPQETKRKEALHWCSQKRQTDGRNIFHVDCFQGKDRACSRKDTKILHSKNKPSTATPNVALHTGVDTKQTKVQNTNATVSHRDSVVVAAAATATAAAAIIATVKNDPLVFHLHRLLPRESPYFFSAQRPAPNQPILVVRQILLSNDELSWEEMSTSVASVFTNITHRL